MKKTFRRLVSLALVLTVVMSLAVSASAAELTFDDLVDYGNEPIIVSAPSIIKTDDIPHISVHPNTASYTCTAPVTITVNSIGNNSCTLNTMAYSESYRTYLYGEGGWNVDGTHTITEPGVYHLQDRGYLGTGHKFSIALIVKEGSSSEKDDVTDGIVTPGLHNFIRVNTYRVGQYDDVPANHTFSENVKAGYEFNIMQGYTTAWGINFGADNFITRLASIIIACRLNCIYYNGSNNIDQTYSGTTQERYLAYAKDHGILCDFDNVSEDASRAEFAAILSSALPDEALEAINTVEDNAIPDVKVNAKYGDDIYRLYRAGILNGSDKKGTFYPDSYINRGAACAIATRMCDVALRKSVNLTR